MLVRVPDALALVGIRLAQLADLGRHLADLLAIGAGHHDPLFLSISILIPSGTSIDHRMRVAEGEVDLAALRLGVVADAD